MLLESEKNFYFDKGYLLVEDVINSEQLKNISDIVASWLDESKKFLKVIIFLT